MISVSAHPPLREVPKATPSTSMETAHYRIVAATGLDKGDREYQQDQVGLLSHPRQAACLLGVVADGMGGRSGGRKASDQVLMTAGQLFERFDPRSDNPSAFLTQLAQEAHTVIRLTAASSEEEPHSTLATFLLLPGGQCHWLHTGDSRIYHFRGSHLQLRTRDQSFVQKLVDRGELTETQALQDPRSNVLLHCLGTEAPPVLVEHTLQRVQAGDSLLACSDGLWHYISEEEMGMVLSQLPPRQACELLLQKARDRAQGRGDNLSLVTLKLETLD